MVDPWLDFGCQQHFKPVCPPPNATSEVSRPLIPHTCLPEAEVPAAPPLLLIGGPPSEPRIGVLTSTLKGARSFPAHHAWGL